MSYCAMGRHAVRPALPCPALPCPALPCPAMPCHIMPAGNHEHELQPRKHINRLTTCSSGHDLGSSQGTHGRAATHVAHMLGMRRMRHSKEESQPLPCIIQCTAPACSRGAPARCPADPHTCRASRATGSAAPLARQTGLWRPGGR